MTTTDVKIPPAIQVALPYLRAGLTASQIAVVLGITTSAANARMGRAIRLGLIGKAQARRENAVGTLAGLSAAAGADSDAPLPFRLPFGLPAHVRDWLKQQAKSSVTVEDVVRGILVDACFDAISERTLGDE